MKEFLVALIIALIIFASAIGVNLVGEFHFDDGNQGIITYYFSDEGERLGYIMVYPEEESDSYEIYNPEFRRIRI